MEWKKRKIDLFLLSDGNSGRVAEWPGRSRRHG